MEAIPKLPRNLGDRLRVAARVLIASYFFNLIYTRLEVWYYYGHPFPTLLLPLLPASLCVMFDLKTVIFGSILAFIAACETVNIAYNQFLVWYTYGYLYINELMVKKFALLGCSLLVLSQHFEAPSKLLFGAIPFSGNKEMSTRKSALMLAGRLLMSVLFLYVGITEIQRQLESTVEHDGHVHHRRAHGDGHDNLYCKVAEFVFSLPLVVGFKTVFVSRALAAVLVIEALTSWLWFLSDLNVGYVLHAREHFTVNMGVAGGLLLLTVVGAGRFTIDELLKKKQ
eukprot:m.238516 g.238516  ORF g.238516 m.238516 type:complete len:283 (+) comp21827_c0_seq1:3-851(+)